MRPGRARALRQFTLSTGKSAGRNSSGRITVFHTRNSIMYLLIVFLPLLGSSVAGFFGRFLGSEGSAIMPTGNNLLIFGICFFHFLLGFRFICMKFQKKLSFLLLIIKLILIFCVSLYISIIRIKIGLCLSSLLSSLLL